MSLSGLVIFIARLRIISFTSARFHRFACAIQFNFFYFVSFRYTERDKHIHRQ